MTQNSSFDHRISPVHQGHELYGANCKARGNCTRSARYVVSWRFKRKKGGSWFRSMFRAKTLVLIRKPYCPKHGQTFAENHDLVLTPLPEHIPDEPWQPYPPTSAI